MFLVQETEEIDGTVVLRQAGEVRKAPGIRLPLLEGEGRVAQERTSGFDGLYLFDRVPLGAHSVRLAPQDARRLRLVAPLGRPSP